MFPSQTYPLSSSIIYLKYSIKRNSYVWCISVYRNVYEYDIYTLSRFSWLSELSSLNPLDILYLSISILSIYKQIYALLSQIDILHKYSLPVHTYIYTYIHTYIHMHVRMYVKTYMYVYVYVYGHSLHYPFSLHL